jgi:hypothetical protein
MLKPPEALEPPWQLEQFARKIGSTSFAKLIPTEGWTVGVDVGITVSTAKVAGISVGTDRICVGGTVGGCVAVATGFLPHATRSPVNATAKIKTEIEYLLNINALLLCDNNNGLTVTDYKPIGLERDENRSFI